MSTKKPAHHLGKASVIIIVLAALGGGVRAQVEWKAVEMIARDGHAMAFDSVSGRSLVFGGSYACLSDTWTWNGKMWTKEDPSSIPPGRRDHAMACDAGRGRTVLFGGKDATPAVLADTWEWDGKDWKKIQPPACPPARMNHAMVFDSHRGRIVLFGGASQPNGYGVLSDTWEWDGQNWMRAVPMTVPPARQGHGMAYDSSRRKTVLFGGTTGSNRLSDTWEWDGAIWTQVNPANSPSAMEGLAMVFDGVRQRTLLFGGYGIPNPSLPYPGSFDETWEWNGVDWTKKVLSPTPPPRYDHSMCFDPVRGKTVLFGGEGPKSDIWEFIHHFLGSSWVQIPETVRPPGCTGSVAFDASRGCLVLFLLYNGTPQTWEFSGFTWCDRKLSKVPTSWVDHTLVYDSIRNHTILFGGYQATKYPYELNETWTYNGSAWAKKYPATSPPIRNNHGMAFDSRRGRAVLFGGTGPYPGPLDDTWEWDGQNWYQMNPVNKPPGRGCCAMSYDAARGRTVLFGSWHFMTGSLRDTWEWDGSDWTQKNPATIPQDIGGMAYDSDRCRVVMFGGNSGTTWEWGGSDWIQRYPKTVPGAGGQMVYDSVYHRIIMIEGTQTWAYSPLHPAAFASLGQACPGTAGLPTLSPIQGQGAWIGSTLALSLANLPTSQPVVMLLGFSKTSILGIPLPMNLASYGMPGCTLNTDFAFLFTVVGPGGQTTFSQAIPNEPFLVDGLFFTQALVLDPGVNIAGLTTSNAGELTIGAK